MHQLTCQQCGGEMHKTARSVHNRPAQVFAILIFAIGFGLLFVPPLGTVAGLIIMIGASGIGYRREKIWLCKSCEHYIPRK